MNISNVMKKIQDAREIINPRYSIRADVVPEIIKNSQNEFMLVYNSFSFGYAQGVKAERARVRKLKKELT